MSDSNRGGALAGRSLKRSLMLLAKRLMLLAVTLSLLIGLLEIGTRLLTDISPPLLVTDPSIGKHFRKSFAANVYVPEARRKVSLRFNKHGFRGKDWPVTKPAGVRRVAVLGDSFVAAVSVDEQDTLVAQLEQMLNTSHPQVTWEVLNFGVSGSGLGQEIALYRELVRRFEPDIVLQAFFVGNDLADNCNRLSRRGRIYYDFDAEGNYRQLPFSTSRSRASRFLNAHSRFYVWQKHATMRVRDSARKSLNVLPPGAHIYCQNPVENVAYAWQLAEAAITRMQREVEQDDAEFALVLIPAAEQVYADRWEKLTANDPEAGEDFDWDYPDRRLTEICQQCSVPIVSMTNQFRAAAPNRSSSRQDEWLFHLGLGHFNERGNELAAEVVHQFLTQPQGQVASVAPIESPLR